MLHLTINLPTLLESMTENYPALKEVSVSVNQDLKMLEYVVPKKVIELLQAEKAIHDGRAITYLQYLQMLQTTAQLKAESDSPRFLIKSLKRCLDLQFRHKACQSGKTILNLIRTIQSCLDG